MSEFCTISKEEFIIFYYPIFSFTKRTDLAKTVSGNRVNKTSVVKGKYLLIQLAESFVGSVLINKLSYYSFHKQPYQNYLMILTETIIG